MVAPDCPNPRLGRIPAAEAAVMALIESVLSEYSIDRRRILVIGFSLGGQGTWFHESRHSDLFDGRLS